MNDAVNKYSGPGGSTRRLHQDGRKLTPALMGPNQDRRVLTGGVFTRAEYPVKLFKNL